MDVKFLVFEIHNVFSEPGILDTLFTFIYGYCIPAASTEMST